MDELVSFELILILPFLFYLKKYIFLENKHNYEIGSLSSNVMWVTGFDDF